ncbi:MAG: hypothetical protein M5U01_28035 [Ardenticatenaceae bacterium]|nr:hypothetical protein [Ardenticatenaceae bacterium]
MTSLSILDWNSVATLRVAAVQWRIRPAERFADFAVHVERIPRSKMPSHCPLPKGSVAEAFLRLAQRDLC